MSKSRIELVIFDCDGVLVDSEMISAKVMAQLFQDLGLKLSPAEVYERFRGGSMANTLKYVEDSLSGPIPFNLEAEYRKQSFIAYRNEMQAIPGVESILNSLSVKKCVCSNGPQSKIKLNLEVTELQQYFDDDAIHSAYDIKKWKPLPGLFLHAAAQHQVQAENCLVIEDSLHGAEAAQAAGMVCLGYAVDTSEEAFAAMGAVPIQAMSQIKSLYPSLFL